MLAVGGAGRTHIQGCNWMYSKPEPAWSTWALISKNKPTTKIKSTNQQKPVQGQTDTWNLKKKLLLFSLKIKTVTESLTIVRTHVPLEAFCYRVDKQNEALSNVQLVCALIQGVTFISPWIQCISYLKTIYSSYDSFFRDSCPNYFIWQECFENSQMQVAKEDMYLWVHDGYVIYICIS